MNGFFPNSRKAPVLLSIRKFEIVSVTAGLSEVIVAVKTGGQAEISERLVQRE